MKSARHNKDNQHKDWSTPSAETSKSAEVENPFLDTSAVKENPFLAEVSKLDNPFVGNATQSNPFISAKAAPVQRKGAEEEELQMKQADNAPIQGKGAEEEELQMKQADNAAVQRKGAEEEELQMKEGGELSGGGGTPSMGAGSPLPKPLAAKVEQTFGTDLSGVNIHTNSREASNLGALAYTQGNDIHFAPGKYEPETPKGQELLGHELAHVVQQREGRVQANTQLKGRAVNDSPALEQEADQMGAAVAANNMAQAASIQMKSASTATSPSNAPKQMKIANFDEFYKATYVGKLARRGDETKAIDEIMKEYLTLRDSLPAEDLSFQQNKDVLLSLLKAIKRYSQSYIDDNTASKNKTKKKRAALFGSFMGRLDTEVAEISGATLPQGSTKTAPSKTIASTRAQLENQVEAQIDLDNTPQNASNAPTTTTAPSSKEQMLAGGKAGMEESEKNAAEEEADESQGMENVEGFADIADASLGGEGRTGLADFTTESEKEDILSGKSDEKIVKGTKGDTTNISDMTKKVAGFAADAVTTTKGLISLGYYFQKNFKEGITVENAWNFLSAMVTTSDGTVGLAGKTYEHITGEKHAGLEKAGGALEIAQAVVDVGNAIKSIIEIFKKSKEKEEELQEAKKASKTEKIRTALEVLAQLSQAGKAIVIGVKAGMELFGSGPTTELLNAIPGIDIAFAGINFLVKAVSLFETKMSINAIERTAEIAGRDLGDNNVNKLKTIMNEEKDLRAKKANLEALYEEDGVKLRKASTTREEKQEILQRREGTKKALEKINNALNNKEAESDLGFNDQNDASGGKRNAVQEYKLATNIKEQFTERYPDLIMGMITDGIRIVGGIMTLAGPAAPIGAILKGAGAAIDLSYSAGKQVTSWGRDRKAKTKAKEMSLAGDQVNTGMRQSEGVFSFNENKSSFAQSGEKKNLLRSMINRLINYTEKGNAKIALGTETASLTQDLERENNATNKNTQAISDLNAKITKNNQSIAAITQQENTMITQFGILGVDLKRVADSQKTPEEKAKMIAKAVMSFK